MEKEELGRRRKDGWFDVSFAIEALGVTSDVVESALKKHTEKMSRVKDLIIYEKDFRSVEHVKNPMHNVHEAYSQIVHVKFLVKNLETLLNVVMTYGPSSIEILGPDKKVLEIREVQSIANNLAAVVHQFASIGAGGILITPEEKRGEEK